MAWAAIAQAAIAAASAYAQAKSAEQKAMTEKLAQAGPPPAIQAQAQPVGPGTALVSQAYDKALSPKIPRMPGEAQTSQSVGQLLSSGY